MTIEDKVQADEKVTNDLSNKEAKAKALGLVTGLALTYGVGCVYMGVKDTNDFFRSAFFEMPKAFLNYIF
jgi:hypothetical protein